MHAQRFWSYTLLVLFLGWAIMGCYPLGTMLSMDETFADGDPVKIVQLLGIIAMAIACLAAIMRSSLVLIDLIKVKSIDDVYAVGSQKAARLSREAPFAIFGTVGIIVRTILDYREGLTPGSFVFVILMSAAILLAAILISVRTVIFVYPPPHK